MSAYEVVYSAALEREAVEAARRAAVVQPSHGCRLAGENTRAAILDCLRRHPCITLGEIAAWTGLPVLVVNSAIYRLRELRYVKRSHAQNENRRQPVRYWAA